MKLEETLNGGYAGLYGEVVDKDIYHLRTVENIVSINDPEYIHEQGHTGIDFVPDVVFDFGANIGIFSRYARTLWPKARIIAVEPHSDNCETFKMFTAVDANILLIEKAIGTGKLYHQAGAVNGSGESYISPGVGMDAQAMQALPPSEVEMIMPDELIKQVKPGEKFLVKMDIEGGENAVFNHKPSMEALRRADYFCMEVHFYGLTKPPREEIMKVLKSFEDTHTCKLDHVNFYARKK